MIYRKTDFLENSKQVKRGQNKPALPEEIKLKHTTQVSWIPPGILSYLVCI